MILDGTLHVALQDGFAGEVVVVRVDGREVYRAEHVETDPRISLADSVDIPWTRPPAVLEVQVPEAGLAASTPLSVGAPWVGVSIVSGRLHFRLSEIPFGYA